MVGALWACGNLGGGWRVAVVGGLLWWFPCVLKSPIRSFITSFEWLETRVNKEYYPCLKLGSGVRVYRSDLLWNESRLSLTLEGFGESGVR